jgi:hypothetical protein
MALAELLVGRGEDMKNLFIKRVFMSGNEVGTALLRRGGESVGGRRSLQNR